MRILLDENMPRKLRAMLITEGHDVDSVRSLRFRGSIMERFINLPHPVTIFASRVMLSFREEWPPQKKSCA